MCNYFASYACGTAMLRINFHCDFAILGTLGINQKTPQLRYGQMNETISKPRGELVLNSTMKETCSEQKNALLSITFKLVGELCYEKP